MKQKRIIIWSTAISDLFDDKSYGIAVQLYFWAQIFVENNWHVISLTRHHPFIKEGIVFRRFRDWGKLDVLHVWIGVLWFLLTKHPQIIISRGASRDAFPLSVVARWFGVKYACFGASDVNFEPGNELIAGGKHNRRLWQKAVRKMNYIVVQNQHQYDTLKINYTKEGLILFNIWGKVKTSVTDVQQTDVVWVANYRPLKRPEWIIEAAKRLPCFDFSMVGGAMADKNYYNKVCNEASGIQNLHMLGARSFAETCHIVSKSRLLCCTSTFEGFPNTFLQAWSADIPVVSTVDPSGVIVNNNLGVVVESYEDFINALKDLLSNDNTYESKRSNVERYFNNNHSANMNYNKLIEYIS